MVIHDCSGDKWFDFGNPQGLWDAARWYMEVTGEFRYAYPSKGVHLPYVSNEAQCVNLPEGLNNLLIYEEPEEELISGTAHQIIGQDFVWKIRPSSKNKES